MFSKISYITETANDEQVGLSDDQLGLQRQARLDITAHLARAADHTLDSRCGPPEPLVPLSVPAEGPGVGRLWCSPWLGRVGPCRAVRPAAPAIALPPGSRPLLVSPAGLCCCPSFCAIWWGAFEPSPPRPDRRSDWTAASSLLRRRSAVYLGRRAWCGAAGRECRARSPWSWASVAGAGARDFGSVLGPAAL
ncbi:hypothetical protein NDU88_001717 [Pleurodeles waltl]|uniref:Uncharacterized protein n=1 Tax=Pleurodeles waltl TaxID=8319 RepID=A0AAV7V949_PLEWA|nr:hypothetical protein NDU88_001717 [Pleurodeles waltl]